MKTPPIDNIIGSTLKVVASENLVTAEEINNTNDKPLEDILNEKKENTSSESNG